MKTKKLMEMSLFAALTAICAQIALPLPFSPVPFSLSLLAVFLTGALLEPRYAAGAQLVYLALGTVGVPVFAGFQAGPAWLVGPTGGYLVAYPFMALIVALVVRRFGRRYPALLIGMALALAVCYLLGTVWMVVITGKGLMAALGIAVVPFVPLDLTKAVIASVAAVRLGRLVGSAASA